MKLLVIGASGRTGRQVVEQALGHGHEVTAFARDAARMGPPRPGVRIVEGDATVYEQLAPAVDGQDAVISVIGGGDGREVHVYSDATANLIRAMTARGVRRLVVLSAAGAGDISGQLPVRYRLFRAAPGMRAVYDDLERMEGDVMLSDVDWTIVRPARLTDGRQTGHYRSAEGSFIPTGSENVREDGGGGGVLRTRRVRRSLRGPDGMPPERVPPTSDWSRAT
jgi:putative NADH-flavin reductase